MNKIIRNEFINKDTGEDLYEKLLGKRITVQRKITKLTKMRDETAGIDEKKPDEKSHLNSHPDYDTLDDEIKINWNLSGIWYSEGFKYMLDLNKDFKVYLFSNSKYVYEVIPSDDMNLFDYNKYENSNEFVSYRDCIQAFDGIEESFENKLSNYPHFVECFGVIWRLKPGFKLRLLYKCIGNEPLTKDKKFYRFYFKSMNEDIIFSP